MRKLVILILVSLLFVAGCTQRYVFVPGLIPGYGNDGSEKQYTPEELSEKLNLPQLIKYITGVETAPDTLDIRIVNENATRLANQNSSSSIKAIVDFTNYFTGSVRVTTGSLTIDFLGTANQENGITGFTISITDTLKIDDLVSDELYTVSTPTGSTITGSVIATATTSGATATFSSVSNISIAFTSQIIVDNETVNASGIEGTGENESSAYTISTPEELIAFQIAVNNGSLSTKGKYFKLGDSIDLGGIEWTPIGNSGTAWKPSESAEDYAFAGNFNGNGYVISNFTINSTTNNTGFFGVVSEATISGIKFSEASVNSSATRTAVFAGAVNFSDISDITIESDCTVSGGYYTAGVIGAAWDNIISGCINNATISKSDQQSGGVIGYAQTNTITACTNNGAVTSSSNFGVGGIIGIVVDNAENEDDVDPTYISNCINTANITSTVNSATDMCVGGIIGEIGAEGGEGSKYIYVEVSDCSNTGSIFGGTNNLTETHGIIGRLRHLGGGDENITVIVDNEPWTNSIEG